MTIMPRFYIDSNNIHKDVVFLNEKDSRHAARVLRLKPGAVVDLIDGKGNSFRGIVTETEKNRVGVMVDRSSKSSRENGYRFSLAAAVIKPERMEILVQKSCELGVFEIFPLLTERTVIKLSEERRQSKAVRWRKIAEESCKQCGLAAIPVIHEAQSFKSFLARLSNFDTALIPTLAKTGQSLRAALEKKNAKNIVALIGPEGDFTPAEVEQAIASGAVPVGLGPLVLRSETAAIYVLSAAHVILTG